MVGMKNIVAIIGSASSNSANLKLVEHLASLVPNDFSLTVYSDLKLLPHFDPELSADNPPQQIVELRNMIALADGIIICTPEYVFSIPSGLKNALEWCVATTVFSDKPCGLITASASGVKGHEELQLIMNTVMANYTESTSLLIQGVKGKFNKDGVLHDPEVRVLLSTFMVALIALINKK
jgi:chromate reductase, NAD(P)H dehydrogenase (quinone)